MASALDAYIDARRLEPGGSVFASIETFPSKRGLWRHWLRRAPFKVVLIEQKEKVFEETIERVIIVDEIRFKDRMNGSRELHGTLFLEKEGPLGFNFWATVWFHKDGSFYMGLLNWAVEK